MTLLIDAMSAYLGQLLEKHEAGQPLVWEDLVAAKTACSTVLRQSNNDFVSGRMVRLHQSQINAYRQAANKSIKDWAMSVPLQPMEDGDTKIVFAERCAAAINTTAVGSYALPNWRLATAKATAITEIRKRATAAYEKYHPVEEDVAEKKNGDEAGSTNKANGGDNGTETEDGEMAGDDLSVEDGETKAAKQATAKYTHPNRNRLKIAAARKGTNAKGGPRGIRGGRGIRQGGRGRGNGNGK